MKIIILNMYIYIYECKIYQKLLLNITILNIHPKAIFISNTLYILNYFKIFFNVFYMVDYLH